MDLALQHHTAGRLPQAESIYQQILRTDPNQPVALHFLGVIAHQAGKNDIAVDLITKALAIKPDYAEAHSNIGLAFQDQGRLNDAVAAHHKAIKLKPGYAEAYSNLGAALQELGKPNDAVAAYHKAIELKPDYAEAHNNLGNALQELGKLNDAVAAYHKAIELKPNYAKAMSNLGAAFLLLGKPVEALDRSRKALDLDPTLVDSRIVLSKSLENLVPHWHLPMMNDTLRNDAYLAALSSAITADTTVLEIGTGSGLLAMMAARLGPRDVTTCEAVALIADVAEEIIAVNGLASSINVIAKKSTDLVVGVDLARRADLLVFEIFSSEFLGEGVLSTIEDAKRRLLVPAARIIPASGSIMIALISGAGIGNYFTVDDVGGFDLSMFNAITSNKLNIFRSNFEIELLTDNVEAFTFDFNEGEYLAAEQKTLKIPIKTAGRCYGIIQWNRMRMDDAVVFENHPSEKVHASAWTHPVYVFEKPTYVEPGQTAIVSAMHNRKVPWFALERLS